jgi:hypothetical protein
LFFLLFHITYNECSLKKGLLSVQSYRKRDESLRGEDYGRQTWETYGWIGGRGSKSIQSGEDPRFNFS